MFEKKSQIMWGILRPHLTPKRQHNFLDSERRTIKPDFQISVGLINQSINFTHFYPISRYISGKRPDYARRYSESESEEEEQDFVNK